MRTIGQLRCCDGYSFLQVSAHLVCVDSRIDEYLRSVVIHIVRRRVIIGIGAIASVLVAAVAHESGESGKSVAIDVAPTQGLGAHDDAVPRPRVAQCEIVVMVIGKRARRGHEWSIVAAVVGLVLQRAHAGFHVTANWRLPPTPPYLA